MRPSTIRLPDDLLRDAKRRAECDGESFAAYVRGSLQMRITYGDYQQLAAELAEVTAQLAELRAEVAKLRDQVARLERRDRRG